MNTDYEDEEYVEDVIRSAREVALRSIALHCLVAAAYGNSKKAILRWLEREQLRDILSPNEQLFFEIEDPTKQFVINATWRVEALVSLVWGISKIPDMDPLTDLCNTDRLIAALPQIGGPASEYIETAFIRPDDEINSEYEKVYDAHWEVRDAQLNGKPIPKGFNPSVVRERHYGFNWLIGYCGQEWDEISTDT